MTSESINGSALAEAERAIVTSCITFGEIPDEVELEPKHFAGTKWKAAWQVLQRLRDKGEPLDPILVADTMREEGYGDMAPHELVAGSEGLGSVPPLAKRLMEGYVSRQVAFACSEALQGIKEGKRGTEALDEALRALSAVDTGGHSEAMPVKDLVLLRMRQLTAIAQQKAAGEDVMTGIPTKITKLDDLLGGLQRGIVTVAAGRPGMGKSAFAMSAVDGASSAGIGCHVFNLEDAQDAYTDRMLSRTSRVALESLRRCDLNRGDLASLDIGATKLLQRTGWVVDGGAGLTAEEMVRRVRKQRKANKTELVVIDYLQYVKGSSHSREKHEVYDHAMQVFADAAKNDSMSYMVLSQLNRECERRDDKRPMLSDLKASGGIEEKAKAVIMLYRPAVYEDAPKHDDGSFESIVEMLIRKNNHGRTGIAQAHWEGKTVRMT